MTDGNCNDCGIAYDLHSWVDGVCVCPHSFASSSLWESCHELMKLDVNPGGAVITCPSQYPPTPMEYPHSTNHSGSSPDPLDFLSVLNKQRSQQQNSVTRRSDQLGDVTIPLRRSTRLENRRRARESGEPYSQAQGRRPSLGMAAESTRRSHPRRMSLQDRWRPSGSENENEAVLPAQKHPLQRFRRESLQPHVLNRMVPVEDMDPFVGFRPFTDLEPGQQRDPVTVREPMKDLQLQRPPFGLEWNPSVVFPEVGGMRVRVGQFKRTGHLVEDTTMSPSSGVNDGNESIFSGSGSEGYFTAQDWSSSSSSTPEPHPSNPGGPGIDASRLPAASPPSLLNPPGLQPEFIQGSSGSVLLLKPQTVACVPRDPYPSFTEQELPQFEALAQHYIAVQNAGNAPSQPIPLPRDTTEPAPSTFSSPSPMVLQQPEGPEILHWQQASCNVAPVQDASPPTQPPQIEQPSALTRRPPRSIMPCTLPGTKITDYRSDSSPSLPDRVTELAVDPSVDWATGEPWEYIHRVLTSSTCPLVVFLKTPTTDIPAAVLGALGEELQVQGIPINNERWLLIGPRDVDIDKFRVSFQERAGTPGEFAVRFGNLTWGADVNQIEDEVVKAVIKNAMRGGGTPATLPAVFMTGTLGGLAVWYALSLM
ncbi:hypothetical protein BJV78DRAFT_1182970 [Lactifluus subvellereus]|nr:hypothetical protein BJV78DRAFT_1182970 [Lactifluus subvellereus]